MPPTHLSRCHDQGVLRVTCLPVTNRALASRGGDVLLDGDAGREHPQGCQPCLPSHKSWHQAPCPAPASATKRKNPPKRKDSNEVWIPKICFSMVWANLWCVFLSGTQTGKIICHWTFLPTFWNGNETSSSLVGFSPLNRWDPCYRRLVDCPKETQ